MPGFIDSRMIEFKDTGIFLGKNILDSNTLMLSDCAIAFVSIYALVLNEKKNMIHFVHTCKNHLHKVSIREIEGLVLEELFEWLLENTKDLREEKDIDLY